MNFEMLLQLCEAKGYQTFLLCIMEVTINVLSQYLYILSKVFQSSVAEHWNIKIQWDIFFIIYCRSDLQMYQCSVTNVNIKSLINLNYSLKLKT